MSLLDWQHASIAPLFLFASIPARFQNYDDPVSRALTPPTLPSNLEELDESKQIHELGVYYCRLVHYLYVMDTKECNEPHFDALRDQVSTFLRRLAERAGAPWDGETHALKTALIDTTEMWGSLMGEGVPCPVVFEAEDVRKTKELTERLKLADENWEGCRRMVGFETETCWVSNEHYEMAKKIAESLKRDVLMAIPEEEDRAKFDANWFLDDMDETDYM